jgi:3-hydroxyacyl-CoA dehydrogenase
VAIIGQGNEADAIASVLQRAGVPLVQLGTASGDLATLHDCDFVLECTQTPSERRPSLLRELERHISEGAIVATHWIGDALEQLAGALRRPDQFLGARVVPDARRAELAPVEWTAPGVLLATEYLFEALGLQTVEQAPDGASVRQTA